MDEDEIEVKLVYKLYIFILNYYSFPFFFLLNCIKQNHAKTKTLSESVSFYIFDLLK